MRLLLPQSLRAWRTALLFVAVACATPSAAYAGCGDDMTAPSAEPGSHKAQHIFDPSSLPCHGPHCSATPARERLPITLTPVTQAVAKDVLDSRVRIACRPAEPRSVYPVPPSDGPTTFAPTSVFRPPRVG